MKLDAVLFDAIGTTIIEKDSGTIMRCFENAFLENNIPVDNELVRLNRGKDKIEIISLVLEKHGLPRTLVPKVYDSFKKNLLDSLDNFAAHACTERLCGLLREKNIKCGLGSGLDIQILQTIAANTKLKLPEFDYVATASDNFRPRPHPDMIFDMMRRLRLSDKTSFLKVGDTIADIQEGKNAGVFTAVVLAGTQSESLLKLENPDIILPDLCALEELLFGKN